MKIGLLTFHRVYNYGAVLQAYSMQKILDDMGERNNEIVDFSPIRQRDLTSLYSTHNGIKRFIKTLLFLPWHKKRKRRINRFDKFVKCDMRLSAKMYCQEKELEETNLLYDTFLIGSDQVWNITKKAESSDGYFLDFVKQGKRKISYASSIGVASYEQLVTKGKLLAQFNAISCREKGGASILSKIVGREVPVVLDPTLLVNPKHLLNISVNAQESEYILYYSLDGCDKKDNNIEILKALSEKLGLQILFVTPEWPMHNLGKDIIDAGPKEFLGLIKNASIVCTNSFHGTALSIKMNKSFYVLEDGNIKDERKRSILEQLDLNDRIISSINDVMKMKLDGIDYNLVNEKLEELQQKSMSYLRVALHEEIMNESCEVEKA